MSTQFKKKNSIFNYNFLYLLIHIIILFCGIESQYKNRIIITFENNGNYKYISDYYFENYKNKISSITTYGKTYCHKRSSNICEVKEYQKTIILNFDRNIKVCEYMFKGLTNIIEIDLSGFDSSNCVSMAYMFQNCNKLENIIFGDIDTSRIINMKYLFDGCFKLESLDLSNFDTSEVINMSHMFSRLYSLASLKLSENFNTSNVNDMSYMFNQNKNMTSFDLAMLDTSRVKNMSNMFSDNYKLKSLVISNFVTTSVESINNMFSNCYALHYIDIKNFTLNEEVEIKEVFLNKNNTLKLCIENEKTINYLIGPNDKDRIICSDTCIDENYAYISEDKQKCVQNCENYIYDILCYNQCPENTKDQNKICLTNCDSEDYVCKENEPEGYYFDEKEKNYKECFKNCILCYGPGNITNHNCKKCRPNYELFNDFRDTHNCYEVCPYYYYYESDNYKCTEICKENYNKTILEKMRCIDKCSNDNIYKFEFENFCFERCPNGTIFNEEKGICEINSTKSTSESNDFMITNFKERITDGSFNNIINNIIEEGKDYIIPSENILYQMTTSDNQKNSQKNVSTIDLGDCEKILKEKYDIEESIPLIIFKVDYFMPGTLIPLIGYEVYHPLNKSKLDLSYCNNTVSLNIPVTIDENKIYKYNPNDDYYKDECSSYTSDNGTDILLYDRKKVYSENNLSLCESNCYYQGYDKNSKQSICDCKIKNNIEYISDISNNPNVLSQAFNVSENDLGYTNIFACTKNVFTVNGILKNMSSYILIISLLFFLATSFFFKRRGYRILINHINNIINDKMKHRKDYNKNKDSSNKSSKYKNISLNYLKNNEKINFPPKKLDSKQTNIYFIDNNNNSTNTKIPNLKNHLFQEKNNDNLKVKKRKSKKNIRKKDSSIKIIEASSQKNMNEIVNIKNFPDCEMNLFNYSEAVSYDNRTYFQYYISLLKVKQLFLFAFCPNDDYNSRLIKIGIFILSFNIHYATNFVYFLNENIIHKIFEDNGKYDIKFFLPYIIITFAISYFITFIIKLIFLSDSNIIQIKKQKLKIAQDSISSIRRKLVIKYILFYIIGILFHLFFWIALSSFSTMYTNTQVFVLENALIAFGISLIFPFIFNIIPCILRIFSLRAKDKNHNVMFNISKLLQLI